MFCIAAFIVFAILGIFSASYRKLASKAWHCVLRRVTLKPCDINFSEEVKGRLLGKLVISKPRLAQFLDKSFDWIALVFVILSIWSVISVFSSGLNLWVYDTCNPVSGESCSLSGEACAVGQSELSLGDAINENRIGEWIWTPFKNFGETISRIPDRLKNWQSEDYLPSTATYYYPVDPNKSYAIEALDPGCIYCKKLFGNIKKANFEAKHNFTYLLYPIPDPKSTNGYKFKNSYLIASYIEATKSIPLQKTPSISPDWQLLEKIFTEKDDDNTEWQTKFNLMFTSEEAEQQLKLFLGKIGYAPKEILNITQAAHSEKIKALLAEQKNIVENKLKTVKIPTIVFDGRRYDRVIDIDALK